MIKFYPRYGKRAFDILGSACLLVPATPVMGAIAIALRLGQGSPVLFRHERSGQDGLPFEVLKFRTMSPAVAGKTREERVTRMGRVLRRSSFDELPQLYNVLRGDMSLVGPRPLPRRYDALYSLEHRRRLNVRPGLTGLTQISGRNSLPWEVRFDLDVKYVERVSFWTDARILFRTAKVLIHVDRDRDSTSPSSEYDGAAEVTL